MEILGVIVLTLVMFALFLFFTAKANEPCARMTRTRNCYTRMEER